MFLNYCIKFLTFFGFKYLHCVAGLFLLGKSESNPLHPEQKPQLVCTYYVLGVKFTAAAVHLLCAGHGIQSVMRGF